MGAVCRKTLLPKQLAAFGTLWSRALPLHLQRQPLAFGAAQGGWESRDVSIFKSLNANCKFGF